MKTFHPTIEPLEARIAPATIAGNVLSYKDIDGDLVKVTFSKGPIAQSNFTFNNPFATAGDQQLELIDIHGENSTFGGANITFSVKKMPGGDGLAAVGYIEAAGVDLGTVTVKGDLGRISAGTNGASNVAIKTLSIQSAGVYGIATQVSGGNLNSSIEGSLGSLIVKTDVQGAVLSVSDSTNAANGSIGSVSVGGSIDDDGEIASTTGGIGKAKVSGSIGGSYGSTYGVPFSGGTLSGQTGIGPVTVGHDLVDGAIASAAGSVGAVKIGGSLSDNSEVSGHTGVGPVTVGHDLTDRGSIVSTNGNVGAVKVGGSLSDDGSIYSTGGNVGAVKVGHDLTDDGSIYSTAGNVGAVTVGGSLSDDGSIYSTAGNVGAVKVGHDLTDDGSIYSTAGNVGAVTVGGSLSDDGAIYSTAGNVGAVKIGGSLSDDGAIYSTAGNVSAVTVGGSLSDDGSIYSTGGNVGAVTVGGFVTDGSSIYSTTGNVGAVKMGGSLNAGTIQAEGSIGAVTVGGSVVGSKILAGVSGTPGAVTIGAITVKGNWFASSVSAGVEDVSSNGYGNGDDTLIATSSKIASITIGGIVAGTAASGDHFGFDAQSIGSFKVSGETITLPAAPGSVPLSLETGDVDILLV